MARDRISCGSAIPGLALHGIDNANQGVFEILPRDQAPGISQESQVVKTVRVVTTVTYRLSGN